MQEELFDLIICMLALLFSLIKHTTEILLLMVLPFCLFKEINELWLREPVHDTTRIMRDACLP